MYLEGNPKPRKRKITTAYGHKNKVSKAHKNQININPTPYESCGQSFVYSIIEGRSFYHVKNKDCAKFEIFMKECLGYGTVLKFVEKSTNGPFSVFEVVADD